MPATIRLATEADAPAVAAIYAPFCESTPVSFEEVAPTPAEMARRIRTITERLPWLVLEDGVVAGYAYAGAHRERAAYRWSVDVTVYVGADHRRRGVGRALYGALLPMLRHLGYFKAYAGITLPNPGSVGLHEAVGFESVGTYRGVGHKYDAWHDVRWYQLALQPEQVGPPEPRPVSALLGSAQWAEATANGLRHLRAATV
jgi:phosphinothricin acetyltransferase